MTDSFAWIILIIFAVVILILLHKKNEEERALMTPEEKREELERQQLRKEEARQRFQELTYGTINQEMICPHCQAKGKIRTKYIKKKKGVSGGKATAAVLTGGISLLAVGLSRKEEITQGHCDNCSNTWLF